MSENKIIHDLDILRPQAEYVILASKKIDISFIPSGVAIDIISMRQKMERLTDTPEKIKKLEEGGKEAIESFEIAAELCAKITECQYKEMTKEWLLEKTSIIQLQKLIEYITEAVSKSLGGDSQKNGKRSS